MNSEFAADAIKYLGPRPSTSTLNLQLPAAPTGTEIACSTPKQWIKNYVPAPAFRGWRRGQTINCHDSASILLLRRNGAGL